MINLQKSPSQILPLLADKTEQTYRWFNSEYLLADQGYDSQANHKFLYGKGIKPIILLKKPTVHGGLYDGFYHKSGSPVCDDGKNSDGVRWDRPGDEAAQVQVST